MKKFLSILLSCSLICSNAFAADTTKSKSKAREVNIPLVCGLSALFGITGVTGITVPILLKKHHDKNKKQNQPKNITKDQNTNSSHTPKDDITEEEKKLQEKFTHQEEKKRQEEVKRQAEEARHFLDSHRAAPAPREYRNLKPHVVLNREEFKEYLSRFSNSPILFRSVSFGTKSEISEYMDKFSKYGTYIYSTNCFTSDINDAIQSMSKDFDWEPWKCGYLVLGSCLKPEPKEKASLSRGKWALSYSENEDFVACSECIPIHHKIYLEYWYNYMDDYSFKIPHAPASTYEENTLIQIREIQVWLLHAGIVIEKKYPDSRSKFIGRFNPDKAERLLRRLESSTKPAA
ncbi:MAG: hypothetical protein Q4D57_04985 [Clostridia bacterium]|nr:hypothetical protein [Clostridia bacterium]